MKQAQRRSMAWKMPSVSAQGLKIFRIRDAYSRKKRNDYI